MTCALVLYVCLGTPAGYVSARVYKSFGGNKWKSNVLLTSMLTPGIVFCLFFIMNLVLWGEGSSAAVPFSTLVALLALWWGVSVPLTFVGAYFGFRKRVNMILMILFLVMIVFNYLKNFDCSRLNIPYGQIRSRGKSQIKVFIRSRYQGL